MDDHVVSTFPSPPSEYYSCYTEENVRDGLTPKPPPIIEGSYEIYGMKFDTRDPTIRSLESQKIQQVFRKESSVDRLAEMRKINFSILVNFIELLDLITKSPFSPKRHEKLSHLGTLFINIHHLINEYRPHQARETLKAILELQKRQKLEAVEKINKCIDEVENIINTCGNLLEPVCKEEKIESSDKNDITNTEESETMKIVNNNDNIQLCSPVNRWLCKITDEME
ncbi:uncharacterized protein TRIADDRAFT_62378 [Trichoplax adhaerens]|uniref:Mediator of RNA polymerase II transcription subunit 7 n=1 Tax=Trichoplax adhaerens TaxID=10228 RepID=B3SDM1_TRIAD|nr:hypothetical protein TRIADDRAFT_62378 [Trichoplax adhaerens]EDV19159.1 hypothetical protein TRIADDRAFT_62378 [Trichoplax adhaerens]|eukprot:XP_002118337.1 hypothetical protein TRIADDRAFT_62378 [Trichoplax adhaerens]